MERTINFHSPFPALSSAANSEYFDIAFQVVAPSAGLGVVAAEDRASIVFTVVATEAAAPHAVAEPPRGQYSLQF
jgi:hypothetical protein